MSSARRRKKAVLRWIEICCWVLAAVFLGIYAYVYLDRRVYQAYEEWSFERALRHEPAPVIGFVLHSLRFGEAQPQPERSAEPAGSYDAMRPREPERLALPGPRPGSLIGRIEIPRVGVSAMIADGTSEQVLRRAVGHIEGTALPGERGNAGLAGHRDTFFHGLRKIRMDDTITVTTLEGAYRYRVESTRIVEPADVEVLDASAKPTLTLVTCYPFDYIGAAPRRFIVQAREMGEASPPAGKLAGAGAAVAVR